MSLAVVGESGEAAAVPLSPPELTEFQLEHLSSQQSKYNTETYNINWEQVKSGQAAGMPGGWVS